MMIEGRLGSVTVKSRVTLRCATLYITPRRLEEKPVII